MFSISVRSVTATNNLLNASHSHSNRHGRNDLLQQQIYYSFQLVDYFPNFLFSTRFTTWKCLFHVLFLDVSLSTRTKTKKMERNKLYRFSPRSRVSHLDSKTFRFSSFRFPIIENLLMTFFTYAYEPPATPKPAIRVIRRRVTVMAGLLAWTKIDENKIFFKSLDESWELSSSFESRKRIFLRSRRVLSHFVGISGTGCDFFAAFISLFSHKISLFNDVASHEKILQPQLWRKALIKFSRFTRQ